MKTRVVSRSCAILEIGMNFQHERPSCSTLNIFLLEMMFIEKQGFLSDRIKKNPAFQ
jgi:hypothetical protein